jgi:hypothetical protein
MTRSGCGFALFDPAPTRNHLSPTRQLKRLRPIKLTFAFPFVLLMHHGVMIINAKPLGISTCIRNTTCSWTITVREIYGTLPIGERYFQKSDSWLGPDTVKTGNPLMGNSRLFDASISPQCFSSKNIWVFSVPLLSWGPSHITWHNSLCLSSLPLFLYEITRHSIYYL